LRVSTNVSTLYEIVLAKQHNLPSVDNVFTFSSTKFPWLAVMLTAKKGEVVHCMGGKSPFTADDIKFFKMIDCHFEHHESNTDKTNGGIRISQAAIDIATNHVQYVHGVIMEGVLYINDAKAISPAEIMVRRKRMSIPMTTTVCLDALHKIADPKAALKKIVNTEADKKQFYTHLQKLTGTNVDNHHPVCCTAGLPVIASFWFSLVKNGGADIVMSSTAYGGSSQLTDLMVERSGNFRKHKFDITGKNKLEEAIEKTMNEL
jgi:hypothetical protein